MEKREQREGKEEGKEGKGKGKEEDNYVGKGREREGKGKTDMNEKNGNNRTVARSICRREGN